MSIPQEGFPVYLNNLGDSKDDKELYKVTEPRLQRCFRSYKKAHDLLIECINATISYEKKNRVYLIF
jgi:hypothetical protein